MARRTGVPAIDRVIEEVIREDKLPRAHKPLSGLRDPEVARYQCGVTSAAFERVAKAHGLEPESLSSTAGQLGFKYEYPSNAHNVTLFRVGRHSYYVDWTGAQFGAKEWPRCCKLIRGKWKARW